MTQNILNEVIQKAGGVPALARDLGIKDQAIRQWITNGYIPAQRHYEIHQKYDISLSLLAKSTAEVKSQNKTNSQYGD